jgi:hypothetical protein
VWGGTDQGLPALLIIHIIISNYKNFMNQTKQYLLRQPEESYKKNNHNDFLRFTKEFKEILKEERNSGFDYDTFPNGEDIHDLQNTSNTLNISYIEGKYDRAFYYSLKRIDWHLFLSIQFRPYRYKGKSHSSFLNRREFTRTFFEKVTLKLGLSNNDLQYFGFEESNAVEGSHFHIVVHCKRPDKASIEATQQAMLQILQENHKIVIIPPKHNLHIQKVDYSDRTLKYCLKLKLDEQEKPYFHSFGFITFYNRHLNWQEKQKSDSWTTLGSTTSSIGFPNAKIPIVGSIDTPSTEKHYRASLNASNDASTIGVTTHSHHLNCLLDGNRAYLPKNYCDEAEYKQDMLDQYESIKAEYADRSED